MRKLDQVENPIDKRVTNWIIKTPRVVTRLVGILLVLFLLFGFNKYLNADVRDTSIWL